MVDEVKAPEKPMLKKGNKSWTAPAPANAPKDDGFVYRSVRAEPERISALLDRGWEVVSALSGEKTYTGQGGERIIDGKPLDSVRGNADTVLMRLPKEGDNERKAHFEKKAVAQIQAVKDVAREHIGDTIKGEINIGSPVKTIIN